MPNTCLLEKKEGDVVSWLEDGWVVVSKRKRWFLKQRIFFSNKFLTPGNQTLHGSHWYMAKHLASGSWQLIARQSWCWTRLRRTFMTEIKFSWHSWHRYSLASGTWSELAAPWQQVLGSRSEGILFFRLNLFAEHQSHQRTRRWIFNWLAELLN